MVHTQHSAHAVHMQCTCSAHAMYLHVASVRRRGDTLPSESVSQRMLRRNSNWVVEGGAAVGGEAAKVLKAAHGAAANIRALALARLRMPSTCCYLACVWAGALMKPIWALERRSPQCARCVAEARDRPRPRVGGRAGVGEI